VALPRGHRLGAGLLAVAGLCLASAALRTRLSSLAEGELVAIAVRDGTAQFDLSCSGPHEQHLILVSSLAFHGGPFSVQLRMEPVRTPLPLDVAACPRDPAWQLRVETLRRELDLGRTARTRTTRPSPDRLVQLPGAVEQASFEKLRPPIVSRAAPEPGGRTPALEAQQPSGVTTTSADRSEPAGPRTFWIFVGSDVANPASDYRAVRADRVALGAHCVVYSDSSDPAPDPALVRELIETFDTQVYATAREQLTTHCDVDGDGRFTMLLTGWLGRLCGDTVSVGGFVRGADFVTQIRPPYGNSCDMMYLNAGLRPGPHLRTLLAHEYTHAITFSERLHGRYVAGRPASEEESWLDEAIAHLAENAHGFSWSNLDYRVAGFLNDPARYRLVVDDYYAAGLWRGHGNRGSTYLFLRWCVDQHGPDLLRRLIQTNLCGMENLEVSTGRPFADLYRAWSAALVLSDLGLARDPEHRMRFLRLHGPLQDRLLAGPRTEALPLAEGSIEFPLMGTSTQYLRVHSPGAPATRVRIEADPNAQLQVSVVRLPDSLARLTARAEYRPSGSPQTGAGDNSRTVHLAVTLENDTPVTLKYLAWERRQPGTNREANRGACGEIWDSERIAQAFGTCRVPRRGEPLAAELQLDAAAWAEHELVFKLVGIDGNGYAVSAWAILGLAR
jgi:hypothetical protein